MTDDNLLSSMDAAKLYGCTHNHLTDVMRASGVVPVVRYRPHPHGGSCRLFYWHPSDVLRARAERRVRQLENYEAFRKRKPRKVGKKRREAEQTLRRASMAERTRRKILQRIAQRDGRDVKELYLAAGLQP